MSGKLQRLRAIYRDHVLVRDIENKRQKALAIVVHRLLTKADYKPAPGNALRDGTEGFHVSVSKHFNGTSSVSVTLSPDFDRAAANRYAETLVRGLSAVIGGKAKQLVQVKTRRVPLRGAGFTDGNGNSISSLEYVDVTVEIPEDSNDLRTLYARLGQR